MGRPILKTASLVVGVLFALGVVLTAGQIFFFGSSKVRVLFGNSAQALAGDDLVEKRPTTHLRRKPDAGAWPADAGAPVLP